MMSVTLDRIVAEHPFFVGLEAGFCGLVSGCARNVRFNAGTYLFREAEPADEFYLIRHGRVGLQIAAPDRQPLTFLTVAKGEIVGLSSLIPPYRQLYDGKVLELVRAIAINATCVRAKCEDDHDLGYEVMKRFLPVLIERLHATQMQFLDVYGAN